MAKPLNPSVLVVVSQKNYLRPKQSSLSFLHPSLILLVVRRRWRLSTTLKRFRLRPDQEHPLRPQWLMPLKCPLPSIRPQIPFPQLLPSARDLNFSKENQALERFVNLTKTWEKIPSNVTMKEFMILLMNFVSPSKSKDHQTKRDLILVSA